MVWRNKKKHHLRKLLLNKFFRYGFLSLKNLFNNNFLVGKFIIRRNTSFITDFSFYKLIKYYYRLFVTKKGLFFDFFLYFLNFFLHTRNSILLEYKFNKIVKSFFSYINTIFYTKVKLFKFLFTINLLYKTVSKNLHGSLQAYYIFWYSFIILFFKKMVKLNFPMVIEPFVDIVLSDKDKQKKSANDHLSFFFKRCCSNEYNVNLFLLSNVFFFKPIFSDLSLFFRN